MCRARICVLRPAARHAENLRTAKPAPAAAPCAADGCADHTEHTRTNRARQVAQGRTRAFMV
eukprot:2820445-Prymnesium_polylepis.1